MNNLLLLFNNLGYTILKGSSAFGFKFSNEFRTDGASLPRFLWFLLGHPFGLKIFAASVKHDYFYQECLGRKCADLNYRQDLKVSGVGFIRRNLFYLGVRLGGWVPYNKYKKRLSNDVL